MILFSIIVPVYNVEPFLCKCINSIQKQKRDCYEVIITDDGSMDKSAVICDESIGLFSNYIVIHKKNGGLGSARNVAMSLATGKYFVFLDSDDWVEPDYLLYTENIIKKSSPDIIRFGWYEDKDTESNLVHDSKKGKLDKRDIVQELLINKKGAQVWKNIYKKELWSNIFFPDRLFEDLYVTHEVFSNANEVIGTEKAFYHYLIREGNISFSYNPGKANDIFNGFLERYNYAFQKNYKNIIPLMYRTMYFHGIQAIHGLSVINSYDEIKKTTSLLLKEAKINRGTRVPFMQRMQCLFAFLFPRLFCSIISKYYDNRRKGKI